MNTTDWSKFKVRCSGIVKILSNSRSFMPITEVKKARMAELEAKQDSAKGLTGKQAQELAELRVKQENSAKIVLSDTCIEYLMEAYAWEVEGMIPVNKESMDILQIKKGKLAEYQAGLLLSAVDGVEYKTYKDRICNDYLSGEIDFYLGDSIRKAINVTDVKNAFDYPGFLKKINNGLENGQKEQVQGYGDITNAGELYIANCLVDNPDEVMEDIKWRVAKKFNAISIESPEFLEEWKKWERSMKFTHIPIHKRVFKIKVEPFTESERQRVYDRVKYCREWLFKFDEQYQKMNLH